MARSAAISPISRCVGKKQIAEALGVSLRTIDNMLSAGTLPKGGKIGGVRRWRLVDIESFIEKQTKSAG
jgi:predicted DNA-binding transcriptional regulator AlpA